MIRSVVTVGAVCSLLVLSTPAAFAQTATAGQLVISEFRVRGPNGLNDEFIEIYNASGADHTVTAASGSGYGIAPRPPTSRRLGTLEMYERGNNAPALGLSISPDGNAILYLRHMTDFADLMLIENFR